VAVEIGAVDNVLREERVPVRLILFGIVERFVRPGDDDNDERCEETGTSSLISLVSPELIWLLVEGAGSAATKAGL